jgi:hypothetical protein
VTQKIVGGPGLHVYANGQPIAGVHSIVVDYEPEVQEAVTWLVRQQPRSVEFSGRISRQGAAILLGPYAPVRWAAKAAHMRRYPRRRRRRS